MAERTDRTDKNNAADVTGTAPLEDASRGGRALDVEPSPEGRLMQVRTIESQDRDPLDPTREGDSAFEAIDERAERDVRMRVREHERSSE
jgi:hypothetical protein